MADVITRFKLETSDYDSKLRAASKELSDIAKEASKVKGGFDNMSKSSIDAAKALGNTATSSTNAKDKVKELVKSFNDAARAYNSLTKEQKQSDFGKNLAESLNTLKGRITEAKTELQAAGTTMRQTGQEGGGLTGILDSLAGKFGLNITKLTGLGAALGAISTALNVAKDAFFASESAVDEWGRTMEASRAVYDSFLQSINSGNFGNFFTNLDNVIAKARAAYDAIDDLNTMMTIINPERTKLQTRQTKLQAIIRREGANSDAGKQAQAELKALEPKLLKSYRTEAGLNYLAFERLVDSKLADAGITLNAAGKKFLMQTFHDSSAFRRMQAGARGGREYVTTGGLSTWGPASPGGGKWVDTRNTNQKLLDLFTDEWRAKNSGYLNAAFSALGQSYGMLKSDARYINGGSTRGGSGGGGSHGGHTGSTVTPTYVPLEGSIDAQTAKVNALQKAWRAAADDESRKQIKEQLDEANKVLDAMQGKASDTAPVGSMKYYSNWLKELQDAQQLVTNNNDWEKYAGQIDFVTKKMKELRGEVPPPEMGTGLSGMTSTAIGAWIQDQQQSLGNMEIGSKGYNKTYGNIVDATTLQNLLTTSAQQGIDLAAMGIDMEGFWDRILDGQNIPNEEWVNLQDTINEHLEGLGGQIRIDVETGNVVKTAKTVAEEWNAAAGAIQNIGTAIMAIEDPAAKVIGTIAQAIASIALGAGQAIEAKSRETGNKWEWIAFAASATATMISSIAAVKQATSGYALGGKVEGNKMSGDNIPIMANAGEIILNRAQQGNVASQLNSNNSGGEMQPWLDVEKIWLGLGHYLNRTGKGEIVTTR